MELEEVLAAPAARAEEDSRTLAELAESVMATANAAAEAAEESAEEPEASEDEATEEVRADESPEPVRRWRRAAAIVVLFLLGGAGLLWFGLSSASTGDGGTPGAAVALTPGGGEPRGGSGAQPPEAEPSPAAAAPGDSLPVPSSAPTPTPTSASVPVAPTPTPTPAPTPASGPTVHVGDLDGTAKGPRIHVWVYVHSSSHVPVAVASVSAQWSGGYSGAVSCSSTDVNGGCLFRTDALPSGITVALTVTAVTYSGASYNSSSNHDPDGDSNGTSISVKSK